MAAEYKALTFIHFPFTERSFGPGDMIDRSEFESYVETAAVYIPVHDDDRGGHIPTVQEQIDDMIHWGSLSEDPNAPLHQDHAPVDPTAPTLGLLIEQAKNMVASLQEHGQDVPEGLRQLADTDYRHVIADGDAGTGGDQNA